MSHIVQEDADSLADGLPVSLFPWAHIYSGNRNSALGEAEERAGLLFCSGLLSPGSRMR